MAKAHARAERMSPSARPRRQGARGVRGLHDVPGTGGAAAADGRGAERAGDRRGAQAVLEGFKERPGDASTTAATARPGRRADLNRPPAEVEDEAAADADQRRRAGRARPGRAPFEAPAPPGSRSAASSRPVASSSSTSSRRCSPPVWPRIRSASSASTGRRIATISAAAGGQGGRRVGDRARAGRARPATDGVLTAGFKRARPLGGAAAGQAVGARRGRRGELVEPRPRAPRGLLRAAPAAHVRGCEYRGEHELDPGRRGRAALRPAAGRHHRRPAGDDGGGAARARPAARSTSRCSTGRRSRRGSHRTATGRSASRRRSRTCRAPGAS